MKKTSLHKFILVKINTRLNQKIFYKNELGYKIINNHAYSDLSKVEYDIKSKFLDQKLFGYLMK